MFENIKIKKVIERNLKEWEGKGATILFLGGCNFRCPYCNQKDLVLNPSSLQDIPYEEIRDFLLSNKKWIEVIVISGGEPFLNPSILPLLQDLKKLGFLTKVLSNGTNESLIRKLLPTKLIDLISIDIKAPLDEMKYRNVVKVNIDLRNIKNLLLFLKSSSFDYEISVTPHPKTMSEEDFEEIIDNIGNVKRFAIRRIEKGDFLDNDFKNYETYSDEFINMLYLKAKRYLKDSIVKII